MSCRHFSRRAPRPSGARCFLTALLAVAGLGESACAAAPPVIRVGDTYKIELAAGEFVRAVVEQKADVLVVLLDPEGREILHVDGPNSIREPEEVAAVAERPGLYQLMVRNCPAAVPSADCYTLRFDPPRPAREADRQRADAVQATQEAVDAMAAGDPETLPLQLSNRERALALWRSLGERRREAEELLQLGIVHRLLRQAEPAAKHLHAAAAIYAKLGEPAQEAKALNEAGMAHEETDPFRAVEEFRQALAKAQKAGDRTQQRFILNNLGLRLSHIGEHREAVGHLEQALALARELGGGGQATILNNLGLTYSALGEQQEAIKLHRQALARPDATSLQKAAAYNNLGAVHALLGNWDEAVENFEPAIAINRKEGDRYRLASTLNNLGLAQHYSGKLEEARDSYEEALDLAREEGNFDVQMQAGNNFGILLDQKLGRPAEALAQWREVVRLAAEHPVLDHVGLAARAAVERGERRLTEARETLREAIARSKKRAELRFAADLTLRLARVERELGHLDAAAETARVAVESIESQRNRVVSLDQRALFLASNQAFYELHIRLLMELHRQHPGAGWDSRALAASEQARARSLLDLLGEAEAGLRRGVPRKILEDEQRTRAKVRDLDLRHMELIHQKADPAQIAEAAELLRGAVEELDEVEAELRESSVSYAALTRQPLDVQAIQQRVLGDRALLLEYALGEEESYLWAVTPDRVESFPLPGRKEIEATALDFYNAITARNDPGNNKPLELFDAKADRAGRDLGRMILGPVEHLLNDRILLVVSDGVLQYIPFAALPLPSAPGERILARNQVVSLPSASALDALRRQIEGRPAAPKTLAVLADPVFERNDSRLLQAQSQKGKPPLRPIPRGLPPRGPNSQADQLRLRRLIFSGEEAKYILGFVPDAAQKLSALGFEASYARAISGQLADFRYVHFATHGLLDSQQPKLSKLALSQFHEDGRRQEESFLRLADIYNLDLNADLVALSACQTALGKEVRGEGLVGLTRGFMYAGAARVLASLWSVEDKATAMLMRDFYRHLIADKRPAAEALRRAQLDMASGKTLSNAKYRSPYYWAGFSLQGEWK